MFDGFKLPGRRSRFAGWTATALALSTAPLPSAPRKLPSVLNRATFPGAFAAGGAIAYRLDTNTSPAVTAGLSGGTVGVRFGIMGEL